jgi:ribonucleoside-diphosphate reductase alpha chain
VFIDNPDEGTNPCGEIGLYPKLMTGETGFGFCNLVEVNVAACKTQEQFLQACRSAAIIATLQAGYTKFPYLSWVTEEIAKRDALIGVGLTGIMDNPAIGLNKACLNAGAALVLDTNAAIAKLIGINPSSRCTCIKPGGTAPLELGCVSSGIHPHHARRYFRRITANPNEAVAQYFRSKNPQMVETKPNGDWCITFPVEIPSDAITLKNIDALQFVNNVLDVYENWVLWGTRGWERETGELLTHNVSATVVIKPQDWEVILQHVWDNKNRVKSMTFLPASSDKNIPFCPREEVINEADEMLWNYLITNYRPVDYTKMIEDESSSNYSLEPACGGRSCGL